MVVQRCRDGGDESWCQGSAEVIVEVILQVQRYKGDAEAIVEVQSRCRGGAKVQVQFQRC